MGRDPWSEAFTVAKELGLGYVGTDLLLLGLTRSDGVAAGSFVTSAPHPTRP